jgi:hypothetical protein
MTSSLHVYDAEKFGEHDPWSYQQSPFGKIQTSTIRSHNILFINLPTLSL